MISYSAPSSQIVRAPDKTITFTGAANFGQAGTDVTVYTVTGRVLIVYFPPPFCTTNLGEAAPTATVSLGVPSNVTILVADTNSVDIDVNEWWFEPVPAAGFGLDVLANNSLRPGVFSENVIIACATQNTNAGVLVFQGIHYIPLTAGASLA